MIKSKGFTLIELLLVLAIMGVLLAIILPALIAQRGGRSHRPSAPVAQVQTQDTFQVKYVPDVQGLSPKEVVTKLGLPDGKFTLEGHEVWKYEGKTMLSFEDGRVSRQDNR